MIDIPRDVAAGCFHVIFHLFHFILIFGAVLFLAYRLRLDKIKDDKAKADRKPDQPTFAQPLLALAPYGANLEYRAAVGPSAVHKKYAEFFYVVDGSATLVTGGKLVNEKSNGDNLSGTAIEGGSPRQVAKGDFVIVPEGTPHWFSTINGNITLMSFRLPRP